MLQKQLDFAKPLFIKRFYAVMLDSDQIQCTPSNGSGDAGEHGGNDRRAGEMGNFILPYARLRS